MSLKFWSISIFSNTCNSFIGKVTIWQSDYLWIIDLFLNMLRVQASGI